MRTKFLFLALIFVVNSVAAGTKTPVSWLFMVYMAADNNLSVPYDWTSFNIRQMMQVGSNSNVAIIVQQCRASNASYTSSPVTRRYLVQRGSVQDFHQPSGAINSGNPQTLSDFFAVCLNDYDPQHIAIVLWDHGSGYLDPRGNLRGICFDNYYNAYFTSRGLAQAMQTISQQLGHAVDILACDACMMQMLEVGVLVQPYVRYLVASEQTIPDQGFDYAGLLAPFVSGTLTASQFATHMVTSYRTYYVTGRVSQDVALSALDLAQVPTLATQISQIGALLKTCVQCQSKRTVKNALSKCWTQSTHFYTRPFVDLQNLLTNIRNNLSSFVLTTQRQTITTLRAALTAALTQIPLTVIANAYGSSLPNAKGLAIYYPPSAPIDSSYLVSPFAQGGNQWVPFVQKYVATP